TLSNNIEDLIAQNVWIVSQNNIKIQSKNEKIKAIEIYDLVGRKIFSSNEFDSKEVILNQIIKNNQVLIAKIKLENQTIINRKFIF
ncbi:MAG: T9SS sorting signal type C domain-containing protein, partial [Flavobacterium sp.]